MHLHPLGWEELAGPAHGDKNTTSTSETIISQIMDMASVNFKRVKRQREPNTRLPAPRINFRGEFDVVVFLWRSAEHKVRLA